jgi:two-component system, OmpR family, sensor kinase
MSGPPEPQPRSRAGNLLGNLLGNMRLRILVATVALLAAFFAVSLLQLRNTLIDRLDKEIASQLDREMEEFRLLAERTRPGAGDVVFDDVSSLFAFYFAREVPDEGETLIGFIDGELVHNEDHDDAAPADELPRSTRFWLAQAEARSGRMLTDHGEVRYYVEPVARGGQDGRFVVAIFPRAEQAAIDDAIGQQARVQVLTILIASAAGFGLAGRVLRPLRSLAETARKISDTDLTRRIPVRGQDEASQIASAFNDMLARLEDAFATQRRFLDESSHELRAPLTVIRGHLELMDLEDDPEERAATVALLTNEIDRMNRMVEDLLTLARAGRPDFLAVDDVDVAAWTEEVYRKASVLDARGWVLGSTADVMIRADEQRLTQAVMQLAVNACQHTTDDVTVRIGSEVRGASLVLYVEDDGPGIPRQDAERVFERFQRARTDLRSSGLGLSIVSAIATAHGGRARVTGATPRGARFEIILPLVQLIVRPTEVIVEDARSRSEPAASVGS